MRQRGYGLIRIGSGFQFLIGRIAIYPKLSPSPFIKGFNSLQVGQRSERQQTVNWALLLRFNSLQVGQRSGNREFRGGIFKFQFLIGRIAIQPYPRRTGPETKFQFLIGRIAIQVLHLTLYSYDQFQFLIGRIAIFLLQPPDRQQFRVSIPYRQDSDGDFSFSAFGSLASFNSLQVGQRSVKGLGGRWVAEQFQFLIGRIAIFKILGDYFLKREVSIPYRQDSDSYSLFVVLAYPWFQFLIGRIAIKLVKQIHCENCGFQFLIGRIAIGRGIHL